MRKTQGALSGLRDSLVKSQAWQPEFAHALQTYSNLEMTVLERRLDGCEACHLDRVSNRRATLSGKPYDPLGFEVRGTLSYCVLTDVSTLQPLMENFEEDQASGGDDDDSVSEQTRESDGDDETKTNGETNDQDDSDREYRGQSNSSSNEDHHQFNIGRFCARRAEVFHELTHWEVSPLRIGFC
jgi:hypothetical protein